MPHATAIATLAEALSYLGKGDATDVEVGQINALRQAAEMAVRRFLGCNVTQATYTHYLPIGHPYDVRVSSRRISSAGASVQRYWLGPEIMLPEYPLRSITTLHEDRDGRFDQLSNVFGSDALLTEGTDYFWPIEASGFGRRAVVRRVNTLWPAEPGSIKIVYVAGWTAAELQGQVADPTTDASVITLGVLKTLKEYWSDKKQGEGGSGGAGPIKSESLADYSVTYDSTQAGAGINLTEDTKSLLRRFRRLEGVMVQ